MGGGDRNAAHFIGINKMVRNNEIKSIKELIDTYYPEIAERLRDGKRTTK